MVAMDDAARDALAAEFADTGRQFAESPLYRRIGPMVAGQRWLLELAALGRPGQQRTNLLFASVHYLLLGGAEHELAEWYPSRVGLARARPAETVAPVFADFCRAYQEELAELIRHRLVQTNVLKRSAVLRMGLVEVGRLVNGPVTLLEIGCSAGIHLCFDRWHYRYRRPDGSLAAEISPEIAPTAVTEAVTLAGPVVETEWRSGTPAPSGPTAVVADRLGVDLNVVDATDADQRRWLEALVWPENRPQAALLAGALAAVAADPPRTVTGDAMDVLPALDAELSTDRPLVVFHAATRGHLAKDVRPAFDEVIDRLGRRRPLYRLTLEAPGPDGESWLDRFGAAFALDLEVRCGESRAGWRLAAAHGHGEWIEPLAAPARPGQAA